jgi:PAS domain S-box-containing protein
MEENMRISEEKHRLLADNALDVISVVDIDGNFTYISPSVEKLRGSTPAEVMHQTLEEILTPEGAAIAREELAQTLAAI